LRRSAINLGRQDGQAVILVVVAMSILLIGALGLAIDGGKCTRIGKWRRLPRMPPPKPV